MKLKRIIFTLICLMMVSSISASSINYSLFESVKTGKITSRAINSTSDVITTYNLRQLKNDGDELYDYYVLETATYFTSGGNTLSVKHYTNNAAIVFEKADFSTVRLMGSENKFLTFFSNLNNFTKSECIIVDDDENNWNFSRTFFAFDRYFDNTYTFRCITEFRILENKDIQVEIAISPALLDEELDTQTLLISFDPTEIVEEVEMPEDLEELSDEDTTKEE